MKKYITIVLAVIISFSSCKKGNFCVIPPPSFVVPSSETAYLQNYLATNNITATPFHGMFYTMDVEGTGKTPNLCSSVGTRWEASNITGTAAGPVTWWNYFFEYESLDGLPVSWQLILPMVKTGGHVILYVPPSLQGRRDPDPGSYKKYDIFLDSVK